jgi:hypothetical protein
VGQCVIAELRALGVKKLSDRTDCRASRDAETLPVISSRKVAVTPRKTGITTEWVVKTAHVYSGEAQSYTSVSILR